MELETKVEKRVLNSFIIHPTREPGVIDNAMITRCVLANGPTEEAGRLFAEEGVHLEEAEVVRLEFQHILRIDHLWMLTSLTKLTLAHNWIEKIENLELLKGLNELDLSFNKIKVIENIEALTNLEIFTLFHNQIRKLENMESLVKLLVFSIGDNLIEDFKEETSDPIDVEVINVSELPEETIITNLNEGLQETFSFNKDLYETDDDNSVLKLLQSSIDGKVILNSGQTNGGLLDQILRSRLARLIATKELTNNPTGVVPGHRLMKCAHEIAKIFSKESPTIYYIPHMSATPQQIKRNASGKLYDAVVNRRKDLRKRGVITGSSRSSKSSDSNSVTSVTEEAPISLLSIQNKDDKPESETNAALLLLPYLIPSIPSKKKGKPTWKPSRSEIREGFISQVADLADLQTAISSRREKLAKLGRTFQPLVIYAGTASDIKCIYVVIAQTVDKMAYLRQFRFLRSVSFKGNPCCSDPAAYAFLKAGLSKVTYLDYKIITTEEREHGQSLFRGVLRVLDDADEKKEKDRIAQEEYDAKVEFYALSFVEYLSGPELLEQMFEKDPDGSMLLKIGGELMNFYEQYKEQYVETMAQLVEFAQEAYTDRQNEIALFKDLVLNALADSVEKSKTILAEFELKKQPLLDELQGHINKFTLKQATIEQLEPIVMELGESFNDMLHELWNALMTIEMQLFEQCEESRIQFSVNMTEKVTKLMESSRNAFGLWRESEGQWSTRQFDTLSKLLGNKVLLGDAEPELFEAMMDRDLMMNLVASSSDNHMRFIDNREDLLVTRANKWRDDLVQGTNDNEVKRNRDRVLEINYYIDNQRDHWMDLQMALSEEIDPETAALLGDEF